jgi:hypothetical protein
MRSSALPLPVDGLDDPFEDQSDASAGTDYAGAATEAERLQARLPRIGERRWDC